MNVEHAGQRTRILIVDDHPAIRQALAWQIGQQSDMEVCGESADANEALCLVDDTRPQMVIVDITLKNSDGIDLIKRIKSRNSSVRMMVWSMHSELLYAERALRAGAHGYVSKDQVTDQIIKGVRLIMAGKIYLSPSMTEKLLHRTVGFRGASLEESPIESLSNRELEVFRLIGQGVKTSQIAVQLQVSLPTVWTYRDRIREKMGLNDGTELVHSATQWILENESR